MNAATLESSETSVLKNPLRLAARSARTERSLVQVGRVCFGGPQPVVIAGPCSVESYEQTRLAAEAVQLAGAGMLRGGAYKPRTSPYDFQGLGVEALEILARIRLETGLPVVSEVMSTEDVDLVAAHVDMLQVGARNMQNFALLRRLSRCQSPVLLKRGPASTVREWLLAAEYLLAGGNDQVVLCERGIRSYDSELRNTFDLAGMALARQLTHLPVIADPSHGTGRRDLIRVMSRAALAAGADGLIIEVHPRPEDALSDGAQSLDPVTFAQLMEETAALGKALRTMPS